MSSTDNQNVWFGLAMFLLGLIVGAVLTVAMGGASFASGAKPNTPSAPTAPTAPTAPSASVTDRMLAIVRDLKLNEDDFKTCLASDKFTAHINQDETEGGQAGVNGTPGIVLLDMKTKKARLVSGARPLANFQTEIDDMLKNPGADSKTPGITAVTSLKAVDFSTDHFTGNKDAEIAIVEYSDYQCPYCHAVHPTLEQLMTKYGDKVVWIYRHFPLSFHPDAMPFAIGSECVNEMGGNDAFWQYTNAVMGS